MQHPGGWARDKHAPTLDRDTAPVAGQRHVPFSVGAQHTGPGGAAMHSGKRGFRQIDALWQIPDEAAKFLPQVEAVCDDAVDPRGRALPPCIVMEKGESLQDWSNRAEPDLFASLAVRMDRAANWIITSSTLPMLAR